MVRSRKQIIRRIISSIICLFVVILINFFLPRIMPGNPVLMLTGQDESSMSDEKMKEYETKLGLDKPLWQQFGDYLSGLIQGDLGFSYHNNDSVSNLLKKRISSTLMIAIPALILSSLLALVLGIIMGYRKNTRLDSGVTTGFIILDAVPTFLLAMMLVTVFSFQLDIFPLGGLTSTNTPSGGFLSFWDHVWHLILPVLTVTLVSPPNKYLLIRNSVAVAKEEKYVIYAKARGLSINRIRFIHIFKNVCQSFIAMVGLNLGFLISGSMITEVIFSINGMGSLIYDAAVFRDYPTLQGCFFFIALLVIVGNILTDIICILVDPRQRFGANNET